LGPEEKIMNRIAFALIAASLAGSAVAQTSFEYRLVLNTNGTAGAAAAGNNFTTSNTTISFWLQARAARQGGDNFGIIRVGLGPTPADITISGDATIARGNANSTGSRRGRVTSFRFTGTSGGAFEATTGNAPTQTNPNANQGNENGFWTPQAINRWDAYLGFQRPNQEDDEGNYVNPWGAPITDGSFTPWQNIYAFTVNTTNVANNVVPVSARAWGNIGVTTQIVGSNTNIDALTTPVFQTLTGSVTFVPTPGAAALLGLGALAAGRRRR
jgi:MYXO-CTERM domain-containing protein